MKKTGIAVFAVMFLASGAIAHLAYAQAKGVDIPFSFHAGNQVLPPGKYKIETKMATATKVIKMRDMDKGKEFLVTYITRLGPREGNEVSLVFDKVGDESYLSEIHIPGMDGFHLSGAPGDHKHVQMRTKVD